MTSSDLRNHFLGIVRSTPIIFTSTSYFIFTALNPHSSEAEIMLCGRKWTRTGLTCCPV
ncbi:hypothetical protein T06_13907 [Trichinella sp. T6]|nr:hypothetical protein T06_13907 [Trichinella sp. T6]